MNLKSGCKEQKIEEIKTISNNNYEIHDVRIKFIKSKHKIHTLCVIELKAKIKNIFDYIKLGQQKADQLSDKEEKLKANGNNKTTIDNLLKIFYIIISLSRLLRQPEIQRNKAKVMKLQ